MNFRKALSHSLASGKIAEKDYKIILDFYESYAASIEEHNLKMVNYEETFCTLLGLMEQHLASPYPFNAFHEKITSPFDYYTFGVEFMRPHFDKSKSHVHRLDVVKKIDEALSRGENVILFANHQTEVDPQLISLALEDTYPKVGAEMIFVAGDRVITDPLAVPFSLGRNLLCIYSKRHIDNPPEKKIEKQHHNQRTMKKMRELLSQGGRCIYVAPSGGRDRPNSEGVVEIAPFDPSSIEMFRLMAKESGTKTHFHTLALVTYDILPPPHTVEKELGEVRKTKRERALFAFGEEIDMEHLPGSELADRHARREAIASYIWNLVHKDYLFLKGAS